MTINFLEETLLDTPAVRAAIEIREVVDPNAHDKTRTVSEIIQIARKALRESTNTNAGAKAAAIMLTEKFRRNGDGQEVRKKIIELVKKNSDSLINP